MESNEKLISIVIDRLKKSPTKENKEAIDKLEQVINILDVRQAKLMTVEFS